MSGLGPFAEIQRRLSYFGFVPDFVAEVGGIGAVWRARFFENCGRAAFPIAQGALGGT